MRRWNRMGQGLVAAALLWAGAAFTVPPAESDPGDPADARQAARLAVLSPVAGLDEAEGDVLLHGSFVNRGGRRTGAMLPDFAQTQDVRQRKERFFAYLLPLVEFENQRLAVIRERLEHIHDHVRWRHPLEPRDILWLERVAKAYRVTGPSWEERGFWNDLLARVDVLPVHLVLVQAANESAWGTSRFAREGNNLFGQWCFSEGCGMVPAERPEGASYEVARFGSVSESISSYMHNLNTGRPYQLLRDIRRRLRLAGEDPDALELAVGLTDYSERGEDYVAEIRAMIRQNEDVITEVTSPRDITEEG
jgi:Bax protein